ncbi:hypothetical protein JL475_24510 [Streptomyces sp. M2CJ-2]|uniref:hypothetical protein n=1 Tax=Streptomyces sp. M2CJ-2 TaxID=2803948 RepID=UPI0019284098|nr:hypothetical protein [Streptomyces sp. M2CJ-2]MBL3669099.1 hypothetical protein [Streptomyces sp. M2CJ-2]
MTETTEHSPLEAVQALESGAFRLGQVLRRVLGEHAHLPVRRIYPSVYVSGYNDQEASTTARVEIGAGSIAGVRAWAEALGGEVEARITASAYPFEHAEFTTSINEVQLVVTGTRSLSEDEAAAWQARQTDAGGGS